MTPTQTPRCLDCHRTEADGPCLAGNGSTRRYEAHRYPEPADETGAGR